MTEEALTEAVEELPDGDVDSIAYNEDGTGSFLIESEESEQDVDQIDSLLEKAGYERDGFLEAPELCQQWFKPLDDE